MSFRLLALVSLLLVVLLAVAGCGASDGGVVRESGLTAELAVPPEVQSVPTATPTPEPTATPVPTVAVEPKPSKRTVSIPNRGYNSMGDADAPITIYDFSDFL